MPTDYQIGQLADELQPAETGKQTAVLANDANPEILLFAIAAEDKWPDTSDLSPHSIRCQTPVVRLLTLLN